MKNLIVLALYLTFLAITGSCKKDNSSPVQQTVTAEITEVGVSAGQEVIQTIGSGGGTVVSSDGIMELIFPSDALNSNTNISVEPITNNSPGGVGNGYRFGPSGIKFNKPVTLKFHYNDNTINGTLPQFMGIAFQDSNRGWYSLRSFTYDTINKTITAKANHFTDFGPFADLILTPKSENVKINESKEFKVMVLDDPSNDQQKAITPPTGGDDELAPLAKWHEINGGLVKNWAANGVDTKKITEYGTITPQGGHCSFKAPAKKPAGTKNPVQLSVEIDMKYKDPVTKKDYGKLILNAAVKINDDNYAYTLRIDYKVTDFEAGSCTWEIIDFATFEVELKNDIALITGYANDNGIVHPAFQNPGGPNCTVTWIPTDYPGILNVNQVTGYASSITGIPGSPKTLQFSIVNDRSDPKFSFVCLSGESSSIEGHVTANLHYGASFILKDSSQVFHDPVIPGLVYTLTAK